MFKLLLRRRGYFLSCASQFRLCVCVWIFFESCYYSLRRTLFTCYGTFNKYSNGLYFLLFLSKLQTVASLLVLHNMCVCVWDRLLLTLTLAWSNWFTIILLKCYYTIQLRVFLCWILRGRVLFSFPFCWWDVLLGRIGEAILPSFLRWRSISSWSVLSWINGRVDGRNDSNQTTKLAGIVVGSERTQIVSISHT